MNEASTDEIAIAGCYVLVGLALFAGLVVVLKKTSGRSGPVSGLTFVVCGPVLGVVLMILEMLRNAARTEEVRDGRLAQGIGDFSPWVFASQMAAFGLGVSLIASLLYMYSIRDELDDW